MKRTRRISYTDRLLLFFLIGSIGGSIMANLLSRELLEQIGLLEYWEKGEHSRDMAWRDVLPAVLKQRGLQLGLGCLIGMTPLAVPAYTGLTLAAGAAMAVLISVCTLYGGWLGPWIVLRTMLPQWLLYGPVCVILAVAAEKGIDRMKGGAWLTVVMLMVAGAALEAIF